MATFNDDITFRYIKTGYLQVGQLFYPNRDGTNGQVIATDGKGHLSFVSSGGGSGDVSGPASSVDDSIAVFDGTTGKLLKSSLGLINGIGQLNIPSLVSSGIAYPVSDGTAGKVLATDGFGNLSFVSTGDVLGPGLSTDMALARWDGTAGKFIRDSNSVLDNLGHLLIPALTVGAVLFPSVDGTIGQVLTTDGAGSASWSTVGAMSRLIGIQSSSVVSDISANDHIKFDAVLGSNGTTIFLDTASPYSNLTNTASVGRITLQPGHTYVLYGTLQNVVFSLSTGSITTQWWDADNNIAITNGAEGSILGTLGLNGVNAPTAMAVISTVGSATRYELRITSSTSVVSTGITMLDVTQIM
jgi:hypothetical protein